MYRVLVGKEITNWEVVFKQWDGVAISVWTVWSWLRVPLLSVHSFSHLINIRSWPRNLESEFQIPDPKLSLKKSAEFENRFRVVNIRPKPRHVSPKNIHVSPKTLFDNYTDHWPWPSSASGLIMDVSSKRPFQFQPETERLRMNLFRSVSRTFSDRFPLRFVVLTL